MKLEEVPAIRRLIAERVPCDITAHVWGYVKYRTETIYILCEECGRTPLETLNQLEIYGGQERRAAEEGPQGRAGDQGDAGPGRDDGACGAGEAADLRARPDGSGSPRAMATRARRPAR